MNIEDKKEIISNKINLLIDMDIKNDKCDQYTEYMIYINDEVKRSNDLNTIDSFYEKVMSKIDLSTNCEELYREFESIN